MLRVVLIHPGEYLLPELGPDLGHYAEAELRKRGIQILMKRKLKAVAGNGVTLDDGAFIATSFVVWTAGNTSSPQVSALSIAREGGRIPVDATLEASSMP